MLLKLGRLFIVVFGLLFSVEAVYAQFDRSLLKVGVGLPSAFQETALNPCIPESVIKSRFGQSGVELLRDTQKQWPANMCENTQVASGLFEWLYISSALQAQTDRPVLISRLIKTRNNGLALCQTVDCLAERLPRMIEWAQTNLDRTAVYRESDRMQVKSELLSHPRLSLRELVLPLQGQYEWCRSSTFDSLDFHTVNMKVSGKALVLVKCKTSEPEGPTWIIENASNSKVWVPIMSSQSLSELYILPNSRYTYPTLYSQKKLPEGIRVTFFEYGEDLYQQKLGFTINVDASGEALAFDIQMP
ncbi:MAG: hypothetical protein WC982_00005 [Advenella sp.]